MSINYTDVEIIITDQESKKEEVFKNIKMPHAPTIGMNICTTSFDTFYRERNPDVTRITLKVHRVTYNEFMNNYSAFSSICGISKEE